VIHVLFFLEECKPFVVEFELESWEQLSSIKVSIPSISPSKVSIFILIKQFSIIICAASIGNGTCQVETFQNGSFRFVSGSCQLIF